MNYGIFRSQPIMIINDLAQIGSHNKREKKAYKSNKDINNNAKIKSEGEIIVLKRVVKDLKVYDVSIAVLDCMFANAPCLNEMKENKMDAIIKLTDERRTIYVNLNFIITNDFKINLT